jgi:RecB family exonuclease
MPGEYKLITDEVLEKEDAQIKKDSELLKLLFVGITRAKYALTLSFSDMTESRPAQLTKYLSELENWDFEKENFEYKEDDFTQEFFRSISREVFDNQKALKEEIQERVDNLVLSPSRLNDYLECPRKFFYVKVLGIDVEDSNWDNANFGTVIHKILEDAVRIAKDTGEYPSAKSVTDEFYKIIDTERFSTPQAKEKFEKRGMEVIEKFYPHFTKTTPDRIDNVEFDFYGVEVGGNKISGKIDRIEKNNDGTYCLYDYKTGTPASEKKFAPGEEKEGYYNQLCFYKYAFEKLSGKKVSQVGIIYVENHTKNVFKELYDEDMEYIENTIKDTYKNIKELKFNPVKETRDGPCKFCAYKHLCKLDII